MITSTALPLNQLACCFIVPNIWLCGCDYCHTGYDYDYIVIALSQGLIIIKLQSHFVLQCYWAIQKLSMEG